MVTLFLEHTPIEKYLINGIPVFVKREDLFGQIPMPPLAKLRGIREVIGKLYQRGIRHIGVLDTRVSKSGQCVIAICHYLYPEIKVTIGYPKLRDNNILPQQLDKAKELGAEILSLKPNYLSIVFSQFKNILKSKGITVLPHGLPFIETAINVSKEASTIPKELCQGTLIMCVGTGTILSGVICGLPTIPEIIGLSTGKSNKGQLKTIYGLTMLVNPNRLPEIANKLTLLPHIMDYYEKDEYFCPFPIHPNYDQKAWHYLADHIHELKQPILFWNIGA